jgi:hypothetical protein
MKYAVFFFWNAVMFKHNCVHCGKKISANAKYKIYSCVVFVLFAAVFLTVLKYFSGPHNTEGILALILAYLGDVSINYAIFKRAGFHLAGKSNEP